MIRKTIFFIIIICTNGFSVQSQDENPNVQWAYTIDGYNTTDLADFDLDKQGNIFAAINYQMELKLPELSTKMPYPGHLGGGLIKFSKQGKPQWIVPIKSSNVSYIRSVKVALNGDLLVTGSVDGLWEFGSVDGSGIKGGREKGKDYHHPQFVFLARYSSAGKCKWVKSFATIGGTGTSVAENSKGELYMSCSFIKNLRYNEKVLDSTKVVSSDNEGYAILKFKSNGELIEQLPFRREGFFENPLYNARLVIDHQDALIINGTFKKSIHFTEKDSLWNDGYYESSDAFIAKFDASGKFLWSRKIGGQAHQQIHDLRVDKKGRIYATGYYWYECIMSSGVSLIQRSLFEYKSGSSFFYCRFSPDGNLDFVDFARGPLYGSYLQGMAMDIDQNGKSHIVGYFTDTVDFTGRMKPITGQRHNNSIFYSLWNKDSLIALSTPIKAGAGWNIPMDVICKNGQCVVGGIYYGENIMSNVNGKKFKFSEKDHGRSAFLYGYSVPDLPQMEDETDSIDLLVDITPVLSCLSPTLLEQENVWVPINNVDRADSADVHYTSGCGVIRDSSSAILVPNPTADLTKLIIKGLSGPATIQVYSESGTSLFAYDINITLSEQAFELDFSGVVPGVYLISVIQGNYRKVLKLVKSHG